MIYNFIKFKFESQACQGGGAEGVSAKFQISNFKLLGIGISGLLEEFYGFGAYITLQDYLSLLGTAAYTATGLEQTAQLGEVCLAAYKSSYQSHRLSATPCTLKADT